MHRRFFITAGAAGALTATTFAHGAEGQVLTMPFAMKGDKPVTTCFIGDNGPYLMLIDSGNQGYFMMRADILAKLNLRRAGGQRIYGATGTDTHLVYVAPEATFGQAVREKDVPFVAHGEMGGLDGILPIALLNARPTDMDFTTGELRVHLSGKPDHSGFRPLKSERVSQTGGFIVTVTIDGVRARLLVDTGASGTIMLDPAFVRAQRLWDKFEHYQDFGYGGMTVGKGRARMVRSPDVQIGPYRFKDMIISLSDPKMVVASECDGLLGIEILRRFTVGFDAGASTLWLKANDRLADPYPYDMSGLTWDIKDGKTVIARVARGSPADTAGLKVGDRLVQLHTVEEAVAFEDTLNSPEDTELSVEIERAGVRSNVTLTLKDWL